MPMDETEHELSFSPEDIDQAVEQGIISREAADRLMQWGYSHRFEPSVHGTVGKRVEEPKGFNLVTVAYYFGAMLMISACAWFLGDKWDVLGPGGILTTSLVYALI